MSADYDFDTGFAGPGQWAAEYRRVGLQVIPCVTPHEDPVNWKRPKLSEWRTLQEELVNDAVFERWYGEDGEHYRRYNMGVVTGRASGNLLVVDLDLHKNPEAGQWWRGLIALENAGLELETAEQRTGGGGLQKFFRAPAGRHCPTNKTPKGVDIRGQGGFAVIPPSRHESGKDYEWLPGRAPWEAGIAEAPEWLLNAVDDLVEAHGGHKGASAQRTPGEGQTPELDPWGKIYEGREQVMRDHVWRAVLEWCRECPVRPPEREWQARAWESYLDYERRVTVQAPRPGEDVRAGLEREGRGATAYWQKWRLTMKKWETDYFREEAAKPPPKEEPEDWAGQFHDDAQKAQQQAQAGQIDLYEYLDVDKILAMADPTWLVEGMIVEGSLGFIYGPYGTLKTFITLDLALSFSSGLGQWWNRKVERRGAVIYLCWEGVESFKFRLRAWSQHRGMPISTAETPFFLIRQPINFMRGEDIGKLLATMEAIAAQVELQHPGMPISAVFVDTISRTLPGAKENQQEHMSLFVAACDAVRLRFNTVVLGVHHTNKDGGIRGSSVIPGAATFLIEARREENATEGSIYAEKIKDAPDRWEQHYKVNTVDLGFGHTSLALDPMEAPAQEHNLPPMNVCREILHAIDVQWQRGMPWCHAQNSARSAVSNISLRWGLERDVVKFLLDKWRANERIEEQECDAKNHIRGYRKIGEI